MKKFLAALAMFALLPCSALLMSAPFTAPAFAQSLTIYCNVSTLSPCNTTSNTGTGSSGDPFWLAMGKTNYNFSLLFPTSGVTTGYVWTFNGTNAGWAAGGGSGGGPAGSQYQLQINAGSGSFGAISNVSGGLLIGQTSGAPIFAAPSGDCTITTSGAITCTKTNGVSFATSATTDTTDAGNISTGTLNAARLPAALSDSSSVNGVTIPATSSTAMTAPTSTTAGECPETTTTAGLYANQTCPSGSSAFSALSSGTNTAAAMVVGTGASLAASGSGTIAATTAAALASTPTQCSSGEAPNGIAANGNAQGCFTPTGSGTVNSGTSGQVAYYAASGTAVSGATAAQIAAAATSGTPNAQTGPYTFVLGDAYGEVDETCTSACAVTVPPNSSVAYATHTVLTLYSYGTSVATLTPGSGVTICAPLQGCSTSNTYPVGENGVIQIQQTGTTNTWRVLQASALPALSLGSETSVTPNCSSTVNTVTITGNATINAPTDCTPVDGQKLLLIVQSAASYTYTETAYGTGSTAGSWPASHGGSGYDDHFMLIYDGYLGTPKWVLDAYNQAVH